MLSVLVFPGPQGAGAYPSSQWARGGVQPSTGCLLSQHINRQQTAIRAHIHSYKQMLRFSSAVALWVAYLGTSMVHTEISQQLFNGFP